jgi:hypothetical protein
MELIEYLSNEDVARIVALGVLWYSLQEQAKELAARRVKAIQAQVPAIARQAAARAKLAQLEQPPPAKGPLSPETTLQNPFLKQAPAKAVPKPAAGPSSLPKGLSLLDPGTADALKQQALDAARTQVEVADRVFQAGEERIDALQRERDRLLADGLSSQVFQKRQQGISKSMLTNVAIHWPLLRDALVGKVAAKFKMTNDVRLVAHAVATIAAEVGTAFAPIDEQPSKLSRSAVTGRPFGYYDEPHYTPQGKFIPHGAGVGNRVYNPFWFAESGLSQDEWNAMQDAFTGDEGATFKGRGFVQLTGRGNYVTASKRLGGVFKDLDLVANPEKVNDAKFAYAVFAAWLAEVEPGVLKALKAGNLTSARSWINYGGAGHPAPNGLEHYEGAWRATLVLYFEKIEAKQLAPPDEKLVLEQCEETENAIRAKAAAGP